METEKSLVVVVPVQRIGTWTILVVLALLATCAMYLIRASPAGKNAATQAPVSVTTILNHVIGELRKHSKLVVLTATACVEVEKTSEKKLWGVNLGTTSVLIRAPGHVQYVVPLEGIGMDAIEYRPNQKTLLVRAPEPMLDRTMVCVDPSKIEVWTQIGWGRLQRFSGRYLETLARRELCDQMIAAGNQELFREKAQQQARTALTDLLAPVVATIDEEIRLEVDLVPWEASR